VPGKISDLLRNTFFFVFFYFHIERKTEITIIRLLKLPSKKNAFEVLHDIFKFRKPHMGTMKD
jgi:hypothetical protein